MVDRTKKQVGAGVWVLWAILALIVSGLLADGALYAHRTSIEDDLTRRSLWALQAAGLPSLHVAFDGRDATVHGVEDGNGQRAAYVVRTVAGVRVVKVPLTGASPAPASPAPASPAPANPAPANPAPATDKQALQGQINQLLAAAPITFEPDSAQLVPQAVGTVDRVAALLAGAPDVAVEVAGHTAKTPGDPQRAQQLAQQRADVVAQRLIAQRVSADRVQALGHGDTQALPGVADSRRVEIIVR